MYLKYGNYQHATNEASVVISKQGIFAESGISRGVRERWDIQGRLQAADQAGLTAAIHALSAAYALQGQDIGFFFDDGQPSSHRIQSAATNGGVRVLVPPSFPEGKGAEYSTYRGYTLAVEAEWLDSESTLLHWTESLSFRGGGPQFAFFEPLGGLPQKQLLKQATTYFATQTGSAVGQLGYPPAPSPLWPAAEHVDRREVRYELPKRSGPTSSATYTQFKVSWTYHFEDASPLVGLPTAWPF
jgi:hypothetical protein